MVSPEGTGRGDENRKPGRTKLIGAGLAVLAVGAVALGGLTSPSPEAAPPETSTTTTVVDRLDNPLDLENFSVAQIERGTPFEWEMAHSVVEGSPVSLIDYEGWLYVFSTQQPNFSRNDRGGLWAMRSQNGTEWENLGQVLGQEHIVGDVTLTEQGLIALTAGTGGTEPSIWISDNGIEWTQDTIPVGPTGPMAYVQPSAVGGSDDILVVAADAGTDVYFMLEAGMAEKFPDIDLTQFGWGPNISDDEITFTLWGPLGFVIAEVSAEDLGFTDVEQEQLIESYLYEQPNSEIWIRTAETGWLPGEIEGAHWIESITPLDDGRILASGFGNNGSSGWTSSDGLTWESLGYLARPSQIETWNDSWVGPSNSGQAQVFVSENGVDWDQLGPQEHFPVPIQWNLDRFGAGPGGIAGLVTGYEPGDGGFPNQDRLNPPILQSGDATLTLDFTNGTMRLDTPDSSRTLGMSGSTPPEGVEVDMEAASVHFVDIETGETLASFTFDELVEAQDEYWSVQFREETSHRAFVFTPDGAEWTIDGIDETLDGGFMTDLEVTDDRVVGVVINGVGRFSPTTPPGFEIWTAEIP